MFCPKCGNENVTEFVEFNDDGCPAVNVLAVDFYKNEEAYENNDDPETTGFVDQLTTVICEHCGFEFYYRKED